MLEQLTEDRGVLMADGAMGTTLFEMGLESGDSPERLNVVSPEMIAAVHQGFIEAGANLILTNTFGGNRRRLALHRSEDRVTEWNRAGVLRAREAAATSAERVLVAASVGPTGDLFEPLGPLSVTEGVEVFFEQMEALVEAEADLLWIETMSSWEEVEAATTAAARFAIPHVVTLSFDTNGRTMMGLAPSDFGRWWAELAPAARPAALGANCGTGLEEGVTAAAAIKEAAPEALVVVKANCGIPVFSGGGLVYPDGPEAMGAYVEKALRAGCGVIGTCCGSTPRHTEAIQAALSNRR